MARTGRYSRNAGNLSRKQPVMPHFVERTPLLTRRRWFGSVIVAGAWLATSPATPGPVIATRTIPSSGEALPVVGLGSWITFNVGNDALHGMPASK